MDKETAKKYIKACGYKIIEENNHFIRVRDIFKTDNTTLSNQYDVYLSRNSNDIIFINIETELAFIIYEETILKEIYKKENDLCITLRIPERYKKCYENTKFEKYLNTIYKNIDCLPFLFKEFIIMLIKAFNFSEIVENKENED